jgi:hypothetical protein
MKSLAALILLVGPLMGGCSSRDEVLRVASPDGTEDAVVYETNCGAVCSFGYDIWLKPKGSDNGEEVAYFDGATRNQQAWGVNPKWIDADHLVIEYLRADDARQLKETVDVAAHRVTISLHAGVSDPRARAGGMLYNRR